MQLDNIWPTLSPEEQQSLLGQIEAIDLDLLEKQKKLIHQDKLPFDYEPISTIFYPGNNASAGFKLMQEGKTGCLLLAGGQGTRLKFDGPKGCFPVSIIKKKTLFQLFAEKTMAAGKQAGALLPVAIMTSPDNDADTRAYFTAHDFFGLEPSLVSFFCQGTLPLLDAEGHLFLESKSLLAMGPSGNGYSLHDFVHSGIAEKWQKQGIELVNVVLVDNPLADPFDPELFGCHVINGFQATLKCTEKTDPEEKVGVVVKSDEKIKVIEYMEHSEEDKKAYVEDKLKYFCANLSLFCFSMNFILQIAPSKTLPLHKAWKAARHLNEKGESVLSPVPMAWKFETYIFDVLSYADQVGVLLYPRNQVFAPLKNAANENSLKTVLAALQYKEQMILEKITGCPSPDTPFELAADFYYPTAALLEKWKGRKATTSYIEPFSFKL
ncbi:MAG: UTP--glucose-1-phosphate uridylyltransferase [Parachlamydia sp.]|jgi:UDP-N-acetylglucosamine/UDP-N-acetylgalactosamine diphosphorylase|nr:UTP--glucose-1-phosphate uridylyltransferase [Parachlamydia sp.]